MFEQVPLRENESTFIGATFHSPTEREVVENRVHGELVTLAVYGPDKLQWAAAGVNGVLHEVRRGN
jgi:hypothetical protein